MNYKPEDAEVKSYQDNQMPATGVTLWLALEKNRKLVGGYESASR